MQAPAWMVFGVALALAGCAGRDTPALTDVSRVEAPVYRANKTLFLDGPVAAGASLRRADLLEGYEIAERVRADQAKGVPQGARRNVRNRDPLSIVVTRAYVPADLTQCLARPGAALAGGAGGQQTRDIAVLLDVATAADRQEYIAVWYETGVRPGDPLSFEGLLVYATDAWDARFPPYFRLRLVDVSAERNTQVGALLERVKGVSGSILGLAGVPGAAPILGLAASAAEQVLANGANRALVDFTFQLYGASLLDQAGGVPLSVLQSGGVLVTAAPCGAGADWFERRLAYDWRLGVVETAGDAPVRADVPHVLATLLTADLAVPRIVKERSTAIMARLTSPTVTQGEIAAAQRDLDALTKALDLLGRREAFRRAPSIATLRTFLTEAETAFPALDAAERSFFLDALFQVTGVSLPSPADYRAWLARCGEVAAFDSDSGRFRVDGSVKDAKGVACFGG